MTAARTVDLIVIKKYLRWLTVLAVACILMRVVWIFDVFDLISKKKALDEHLQVDSQPESAALTWHRWV